MNVKISKLLLVTLVAMAATACSTEPPDPPTNSVPVIVPGKPGEEASTIPPGEAGPVEQPEPNEADVTFVRNMIVHHQQALDMAELAPTRASSTQVKGLADRIADTQGPELKAMNNWLKQHGHPEIDPEAEHSHENMPGMATQAQLGELAAAKGTVFDVVFLQLMIAHHEGAVTMAKEVQTTGIDIRVQQMVDDVVAEQSDQITIMRELLSS